MIPEIANNFFALAMDGIQMITEQKGYHVLTYFTHEDFKNGESTIKHLQGGRVDSVLVSLCGDPVSLKHLAELQHTGVPVVFFDRIAEIKECPAVTTDDYKSGLKATAHLILGGCKKIACLCLAGFLSTTQKRMQGYKAALKRYAIPFDSKLVIECSNNNAANLALLKTFYKKKQAGWCFCLC